MAEDDGSAVPREVKAAIVICVCLLVLLGALSLLDMQLKRAMVDTATKFRMEVERAQGRQRPGAAPAPGVPDPVPGLHGVGGVGGDGAGAQEDGTEAEAAPLVSPGDESARPPHRGSVNEP